MKPRHEMTLKELHDADETLDVYCYLTETLWNNFWDKVDSSGGPDACWPWQSQSRNQCDYGIFSYHTPKGTYQWGEGGHVKKTIAAHKLAYVFSDQHVGEEPLKKGETILHKCRERSSDRDHDVRYCCNPRHLKRGTQKENIRDAIKAGTFRPFGRYMMIARHGKGKPVEEEE